MTEPLPVLPALPDDPPRVRLLTGPTPLHDLPRFAAALRAIAEAAGERGPTAVRMKREDLMPIGLGGNKVRNLEYVVGRAVETGATTLVATGRPQANHLRLVAAAAAAGGLSSAIVLWGVPPPTAGANERLIRAFGARVHHADAAEVEDRAHVVADLIRRCEADGERPLSVDDLIRGALGARGAVRAGLEALRQAGVAAGALSHLYCGVATGGTVAGLGVALELAASSARLVGVPTHLAGAPDGAAVLERLGAVREELRRWCLPDAGARERPKPIEVDGSAAWEAYGTNGEAAEAATLLARTEGIAIDPIYTARTVASVVRAARRGDLPGADLLIWNGGGIPAIFEAEA